MNNRSRNSAAAATAAEQKQRLQRERERARDTQPTVRTKMWKQTKNISHEHSAIGGALSSAKNSNKRNNNCNNRNRTRIRSVTWRVKRATARAARQRRPRLCRFEPETSRHCNTQTPHTHTHTCIPMHIGVVCIVRGSMQASQRRRGKTERHFHDGGQQKWQREREWHAREPQAELSWAPRSQSQSASKPGP